MSFNFAQQKIHLYDPRRYIRSEGERKTVSLWGHHLGPFILARRTEAFQIAAGFSEGIFGKERERPKKNENIMRV